MKRLITILLFICPLFLHAQSQGITDSTERMSVYTIYKDKGSYKVYSDVSDCIKFTTTHECSYSEVTLYYTAKDSIWQPTDQMKIDDLTDPQSLTDKALKVKYVYVVMQTYLPSSVDVVFANEADCILYVAQRKQKYYKAPMYYRDESTYNEIYKRRKARDKNRKWHYSPAKK